MLHRNQRIAEVSEAFQSCKQLVIVPLVKSDARLIQNIADSHQAGADLRRQSDTLCLSARKRGGSPRQGEIFQSDIDKEADSRPDLL